MTDQWSLPDGNRLTRDDLRGMSPEAIEEARSEGRLDHLLAGSADGRDGSFQGARPTLNPDQIQRADLQRLLRDGRHDDIVALRERGDLDHLIEGNK